MPDEERAEGEGRGAAKFADLDAYDVVVLDAEVLIAYFLDEPGADAAERVLLAVEDGRIDGRLSGVTRAEALYVCSRASDRETATEFVETLGESGFGTVSADDVWRQAGRLKAEYTIALGDAFALATAAAIGSGDVLLAVGGDDDFDPFVGTDGSDEPAVVRFRDREG